MRLYILQMMPIASSSIYSVPTTLVVRNGKKVMVFSKKAMRLLFALNLSTTWVILLRQIRAANSSL